VSLHGLKPFDKEAIRFAYGKFCNYDIELIEDIIEQIANEQQKPLQMAPLCIEIKAKLSGNAKYAKQEQEVDQVRDNADRAMIGAKIDNLCKRDDIKRIMEMFLESGHEAFGVHRRAFEMVMSFKAVQLSALLDFVRITMPDVYRSL
jgi:hypothetical protein